MSRRKVETYQIICDGCGEMLEDGEGYTCYLDYPNGIEDCASNSNWLITSNGKHYCPKCHEWNDDDIVECADGTRYNEDYEPIMEETNG